MDQLERQRKTCWNCRHVRLSVTQEPCCRCDQDDPPDLWEPKPRVSKRIIALTGQNGVGE